MPSDEQFEPEIVAFCCHYCAYAAADLAGVMRLQYPTNIKIVKLPCSGTVDVLYILKAFEQGADGVFVAGCLKGGCHFVEGNLRAEKRVARAKNLLETIGLGKDRLEMFFMSSAEGGRFSEVAREMTERVRKLGPSPIKRGLA
jgi:coenzyme F420-reducing hydrogenase delta subunit